MPRGTGVAGCSDISSSCSCPVASFQRDVRNPFDPLNTTLSDPLQSHTNPRRYPFSVPEFLKEPHTGCTSPLMSH